MEIRQLTSIDSAFFPEGTELLNRTQGRDLFPADYLLKRTAEPDAFVVGAFEDSQLIALGVAQIISTFEFYLPFDANIADELKNKKVGSFSTLCVHEDYQGKGIGQKLSKMRMDWVKKQNCEVVVGVSWVSGQANTSDRVFEKMGFKEISKVENFFVDGSFKNPFICPTCGEPPCKCAAIFYRLELSK